MSRTYKKGFDCWCCHHGDKKDRNIYRRGDRRKTKAILKETVDAWMPDIPYNPNEVDIPGSDSLYCEVYHFGLCDIPYKDWMDEQYNPDCIIYEQPSEGCWEAIADKAISGKGKCVDYSVNYSDKWSWSSDGGMHFSADKETLRRRFDKEVFGITPAVVWNDDGSFNIWEQYVEIRNKIQHPPKRRRGYSKSVWSLMDMCFTAKVIPFSFWGPKDLVDWLRAHEEELIDLWFRLRYSRDC